MVLMAGIAREDLRQGYAQCSREYMQYLQHFISAESRYIYKTACTTHSPNKFEGHRQSANAPAETFCSVSSKLSSLNSHKPPTPSHKSNETEPENTTVSLLSNCKAAQPCSFVIKCRQGERNDLSYKVVSRVKCSKRPNRSRSEAKNRCVGREGRSISRRPSEICTELGSPHLSFGGMACTVIGGCPKTF